MKIAAVNFRGLSLWRLHPGGTRTYLIPFVLWLRECTKGNSPLWGFPLLVPFQVPPGNVLAMRNYSPMVCLGGLLPLQHLWCCLAFSSPLLTWCLSRAVALCCSAQSEAATWDLGNVLRHGQAVHLSSAHGYCCYVLKLCSSMYSQLVCLHAPVLDA